MENSRAKSFVMIMVVIAISALILRVAIEALIKINIENNESNALGTLKLISAALENYAQDNNDVYPIAISILTQTHPAYLDKDYISQSPWKGYNYGCPRLEPSGYSCQAVPVRCKITGNMFYTITTGSLLVSEECSKKE